MQPRAERSGLLNRACFPGEDEEYGLGGVEGLFPGAKDVDADAMNDRAMAIDEGGEGGLGGFAGTGEELAQELVVGPDDLVMAAGRWNRAGH